MGTRSVTHREGQRAIVHKVHDALAVVVERPHNHRVRQRDNVVAGATCLGVPLRCLDGKEADTTAQCLPVARWKTFYYGEKR